MMKLGKRQSLTVKKKVDFGVYLTDKDSDERVLLPKKQVPDDIKTGDEIDVFLYRDSSDRLIATVNTPKIMLDEVRVLKVKETTKIGAFLDWGLEKDLFLPFKEQTGRIKAGDEILVRLYVDKSERLAASMKVYHYLKSNSPYNMEDHVKARIYEVSEKFGAYAAVEDEYSAMISPHEKISHLRPGDVVDVRVVGVKEDGKLDISLRDKAYLQMDEDARCVMELIERYNGELPFNDKADKELIMQETGLSKNAFKRACGKLYKERKITIADTIRKN